MSTFPDPQQTPKGPTYEGRLLARFEEDVVDQGIAFDLGTLVNRRSMLGIFGAGIGALTLAACSPGSSESTASQGASTSTSATATTLAEIPDETAGPYPGDGSNGPDVLENSGIVRGDIRSSIGGGTTAAGVPMTLALTILDTAHGGVPFKDAAVYVWHCDAAGGYSMYSDGIEGETYLRGVQVANADGQVTYTSIFPACYTGRWPHIHFEVYPTVGDITDSTKAIATSQVALPQDISETVYALAGYEGSASNLSQVSLTTDNVFSDDGGALQLATVTGDASSGYQVKLTVAVDTTTTPSAEKVPGGGAPPNGGSPGGTPPTAPPTT